MTVLERRIAPVVFCAAVLLLPVDGLVYGVQMPYWSPISPVLFLAYVLLNARRLPWALRRHPYVPVMFCAMAAVSVVGWVTIGVNPTYLGRTTLAVTAAMALVLALSLAFDRSPEAGGIRPHTVVTVAVVAYAAAFLFGVFTWLAEPAHFGWGAVQRTLNPVFLRQYFSSRPQFLFAEPSYIGMHLYSVLLPMFWLTRDRRLPVLIAIFAVGALAMGSGARIAVDSAVALVLVAVMMVRWRRLARNPRALAGAVAGLAAAAVAGAAVVLSQPRLREVLTGGLLSSDASMSARLLRTVAPLTAGLRDPLHLLFGFGAGNLGVAMERGYGPAMAWYTAHGGMMTQEIEGMRHPFAPTLNRAGNVFTMNAYASFVTEFGLLLAIAAVVLLLVHITRHHAWSKTTVCWLLLLAYLYAQFEAYAFYALPLFLWATGRRRGSRSDACPRAVRRLVQ